jgi:colanic acid/amylovoran biosynthesis glycosyltransferase
MAPNSENFRMAYFLSRYPAVSHTFFLKEILGLRRMGFHIDVASVNPPDRPLSELPPREAEEANRTYYLKRTSIWEAIFVIVTVTLVHPTVAFRGLRASLRLGHWDIPRKIYALFYMVEAFLLGRWMRQKGLSHMHVHFGGSVATVAMVAAETWGLDYSLTIHGPEEFYEVDDTYLPRKIERAKFIFCISDFCRSQLMKYCDPAHWDKMYVVRLGVDPEEFKPVGRAERPNVQIVCVGRLVPAKGQHILLRAFSSLHAKGHAIRLTFVGDGPDSISLKSEVSQRGLEGNVTFLGALNHDETRLQLAAADIFALASFAEGVPVALMEAMAMGIPCVSTCIAGIPELIRDKKDGLLVPPSSVECLAAALESLLVNPELRERLGAAGRARVIERYNLPVNLKVLASTFESCFQS